MVLKAPDSPPAIATVALPVPGPSLCCCPTCRSLPKGASLSPTPSSVFPVPSPWHFHSWREEAEQGENGTCSPRGAQFQPAAHSVRCSGTHVPRQLPGFPLLPPSLLPSGKPSSTAGAEQGGATNGYSWARKGTHGLPPASCALVPGRPDSTARPNPAEPVRRPPRRAAVDASTLARGPGKRGAPASRPRLALPLLLFLLPLPAGAWYKQVASPRYHTVGRAAGLLMGLRRSPYMWRRALRAAAGPLTGDNLSPGPAAREAPLLLPSWVQELWETRRRSSEAGIPVRAPRSPRAPEPALKPVSLDFSGAGQRLPRDVSRPAVVPAAKRLGRPRLVPRPS